MSLVGPIAIKHGHHYALGVKVSGPLRSVVLSQLDASGGQYAAPFDPLAQWEPVVVTAKGQSPISFGDDPLAADYDAVVTATRVGPDVANQNIEILFPSLPGATVEAVWLRDLTTGEALGVPKTPPAPAPGGSSSSSSLPTWAKVLLGIFGVVVVGGVVYAVASDD